VLSAHQGINCSNFYNPSVDLFKVVVSDNPVEFVSHFVFVLYNVKWGYKAANEFERFGCFDATSQCEFSD